MLARRIAHTMCLASTLISFMLIELAISMMQLSPPPQGYLNTLTTSCACIPGIASNSAGNTPSLCCNINASSSSLSSASCLMVGNEISIPSAPLRSAFSSPAQRVSKYSVFCSGWRSNRTAAVARVACPHSSTSVSGVNQRRDQRPSPLAPAEAEVEAEAAMGSTKAVSEKLKSRAKRDWKVSERGEERMTTDA